MNFYVGVDGFAPQTVLYEGVPKVALEAVTDHPQGELLNVEDAEGNRIYHVSAVLFLSDGQRHAAPNYVRTVLE